MDSLIDMYGLYDTTIYGVQTQTCAHCKQIVAVVSFSRRVIRVLDVWTHHTIILHKQEAEDFGKAIADAIAVAELEREFES